MLDRRRALSLGYYGVLLVLLALAVTGTTGDVLPRQLAKHVSEDSEGFLLALVLSAWVQYVRPRLRGTAQEWSLTLLAAAAVLVVGLVCYLVDGVPPRVATLNETLLALAVLLPYVQLPRPVPRALSLGLPGAVLLLVLLASGTTLVTDLAEGLVMLVLVPLGLDVVDRCVLEPDRPPVPARWLWYALLVVAPLTFSLLEGHVGGAGGTALRYAVRVQESFVGLLLAEVFLAVLLRQVAGSRRARATA